MDESGFMLQPVVRRTWAPVGQTPIHYSWDRHDRLSVISAITLSPKQGRLGVYFDIHPENIDTPKVVDFIAKLRRTLGRRLLVIWDGWSVHKSAARLLRERFPKTVHLEFLPPYAPELNPVEQVWSHTKYADLANFIPEDLEHLTLATWLSLTKKHHDPDLVRSFFDHTGLSITHSIH
jgi:transposase